MAEMAISKEEEEISLDTMANIDYETPLQEQLEYLPCDENFEIESSSLKLLKILGGGHFGDVHYGLLSINGQQLPVAVKTPKSISNERIRRINVIEQEEEQTRQRKILRDELKIMSYLPTNLNVVKLLGALTTSKDDFCVVVEYCEYGGMDGFLRSVRKNNKFINEMLSKVDSEGYLVSKKSQIKENQQAGLQISFIGQESSSWSAHFASRREKGFVTTSDLLWFALQIARAMAFLTENKVLHRDVALRNVLLKSDFTVRVADFGLSRRAADDGQYVQQRNIAIPFRYVAPESLRSGRFSVQSEIWSFGVVLWELFTFALHQPYIDIVECESSTIDGILIYLDSGKRLPTPDCMPKSIASMMSMLWCEDPVRRPTFKSSQKTLREELFLSNPWLLKLDEMHIVAQPEYTLLESENQRDNEELKNRVETYKKRFHRTLGLLFICGLTCVILPIVVALILSYSAEKHLSMVEEEAYCASPNRSRTFIPLRWKWEFQLPTNPDNNNGPEAHLDVGCTTLHWFCYYTVNKQVGNELQNGTLLTTIDYYYSFSVFYREGPSVRAWKTMRLMNAKGEEVMSYNDAFKDGYYYYDSRGYKTDDRHSGPGVRLESAKNNNSTFTLFIEVFVDTATIDCKPVQYGPFPSTDISKVCNKETLQTEQFLQYDGGCYVGSNSAMNYYNARLVCNHLPGASIARLAWVENATLLEKLHTALNTSFSPPNRIQGDDFAFLLGAFQMTDGLKLTLGTVRKDWWWINANDTKGKEIPEDWNMWSRAQPNDGDDKNERVIAFLPKRTTFVLYDYFELDENRYLCEYR